MISSSAGSGHAPLGQRQPTASAFLVSHDHDRAAELTRYLLQELKWPPHKVSLRLSVPIVTVEECSRSGKSSDLLRSQMCHWLRFSGEVPPSVPTALVSAVMAEGQRGATAGSSSPTPPPSGIQTSLRTAATTAGVGNSNRQGNNNSNQRVADVNEGQALGAGPRSVGTALSGYISAYSAYDDEFFDDEDGSGEGCGGGARNDAVLQRGSYASLDPYTRAQFDHLRRTVGHNFASILTDPNDPRVLASNHVAVAWDWLGNTFTETFTEGGAATSSGPIQPESVYDLLTYHPVTKATFQPYLDHISRPHNANKVEVAKMKEFLTIKSAFHRELERMGYEEENIRLLQQRQQTAVDDQHTRQSDVNSKNTNKTPNAATSSYLEELPWPNDVPLAFFEPNYDLATLLKTIPARQNNTVWQAPLSSLDHTNPSAYLQSVKPKITSTRPLPAIVGTNDQQGGLSNGPSSSAAVSASIASAFPTFAALENDLEGDETSVRAMLYLQQLITEMSSSEQNVELCLITHVLSQSEAFFEASKSFEYLRDGSGETLSLLHDTRVGVMTKGQSVVESFLRVLRLHRRRKRLQDVTLMLQAVDRFNASLNRLDLAQNELSKAVALSFATATTSSASVSGSSRHIRNSADSSIPRIIGGGQLVRSMVEALTEALRLRFDLANNSDANLLGQINALHASTSSLLMSKRNIQEIVAERAAEAIHPSQWHCADWEDIHAYLESAAEVGTLASVLQQYQRDATHYIWQVVSGVAVPMSAAAVGTQRSGSIATDVQSAVDDPNARRAILRQCLSSLKTPHFIAQVSDIVSVLQDYSIELVAHLSTLGEVLAAIRDGTVASKRAANSAAGATTAATTSGGGSHGTLVGNLSLLDDSAVKAIVLQSLQVAIIEVLESREGGVVDGSSSSSQSSGRSASTTQMTFADVETLLRVCFAFANDIEAFFGFQRNSPHTRPFRATLQSIARSFFKVQHDRQQEKMLTVLQHETWVPNEVIEGAFQDYCDHLVTSTDESISAFWSLSVEKSTMTTAGGTVAKAAGGVAYARHRLAVAEGAERDRFSSKLYIHCDPTISTSGGGETGGFVVPNSLLMLLQSLFDYDRYLAAFPFLAADLVMRIHDALKLYDGQCAGLVLGAGAVETGALPAITVAHLALASQCTGFLAELTPLLQRRLRYITGVDAFSASAATSAVPEVTSPLSNNNSSGIVNVNNKVAPFLQHLDRVRRDLDSHRCEYMAKIPAMVKDKVESSLWLGFLSFASSSSLSPTGSPVPNPPTASHGSQNASGPASPNNGQPAGLEAPTGMFDPRQWGTNRSQWVMGMLKECARIIKHIKPIVRSCDQQGIVVPVLAIIVNKVHEAIRSISRDPSLFPTVKEHILSDLALLKANVDKFGYDTVQCATVRDVKTALAMVVRPSTDAEFYDFFFGS